MSLKVTRTVVLSGNDPEEKREEIRRYFHDTFTIDEQLYETLANDEAFYLRADPLRHPLIFYLGHTATFFVNKLVLGKLLTDRVDPELESVLAVGVDEMSWDDLNEEHYDWPAVARVREYRDRVRETVDRLITKMPIHLPITWESPWWAILMGIEHERIHLETSSVLIRQLPLSAVVRHPLWTAREPGGEAPENELLPVPGGRVVLGKPRDHQLYGWDNEYGQLVADIPGFQASKSLVSNREFLPFVEDGAYENEAFWDEEGWGWRRFRKAEHPFFWRRDGAGWRLRTMVEEIELPWSWPVEVNCHEARAFCRWLARKTGKPIRLPTEEEWYRLHDHAGVPDQPDWETAPGIINLEHGTSPGPVDAFAFGAFYDVIGNVWQWTETPITGFPGFVVHALYDDFSAPTFDARHNLIKGGSWISTGNEATRDARYAFRRHFFQHAGFRYIETEHPVRIRTDVYETDELVSEYCEFHYGEEYFGVENFPAQLARTCLSLAGDGPRERALDLGCAVGRATFELAREFDHVTGLDFSARFIRIADDLVKTGSTRYVLKDEGDLVSYHERTLRELSLDGAREKVEFFQADACNLKPIYRDYDLVLAANLIDRLYSPRKFLGSIHERIRPGGLLVLTSPYTWLTEYAEKEEWIGGFKRDGENVTSLDGLRAILSDHFEPAGDPRDVAFVIRETRRKYQHTLAELTVWRRRG